MSTMAFNNNAPLDPLVVANAADEDAARITIPHAEQAAVFARPDGIGRLWVENEYDELEAEQDNLWSAAGEQAARDKTVEEARLQIAGYEAHTVMTGNRPVVDSARDRFQHTSAVLSPFRRRAKHTKLWYQAGKAGLLCGDIAGFGTAAIWLGELPEIAVTLATSAAVATIAAGLIGVDVRDGEQRRQRQLAVPEPSEAQVEFPQLFVEPSGGLLKRMLCVAAGTAGMIGVGIAALRSVVDDPFIGIIFGGIALAVAGGSFLISYAGADEVADLLEHAEADYDRQVKKHLALSAHPAIQSHAAADAEAGSVVKEHLERGRAAQRHVEALKWSILRRNPSHAGHGPASPRVGGQAPRRTEAGS